MITELKQLTPEILVLLCSLLIILVVLLIRGFVRHLEDIFEKNSIKLDMLVIEQRSTDHALEKSFGNGYSTYKSQKKAELIEDYKIKNNVSESNNNLFG